MDIAYSFGTKYLAILGSSSRSMRQYLVERHVSPEKILDDENISGDTVGNIIAFELMIRRSKRFESVAFATSKFHKERVQRIVEKLYLGKFHADYFGIESEGVEDAERQSHEKNSLEAFQRDFGSVVPCDDLEIIHRLTEVHGMYSRRTEKNHIKSRLMRTL